MPRPATATERFYVPQGHCGFIFRYGGGNPRCLGTGGLGPCVGLTLYSSGPNSGKNGALAHFDSNFANLTEQHTDAFSITLAMLHHFRGEAGTPPQVARISWNRHADSDFASAGTTLAMRNGIWRALNETGVRDVDDPESFYDRKLGADIYLDLNDGSSGLYRERVAPHIPTAAQIGPRAALFVLTRNLDNEAPVVSA